MILTQIVLSYLMVLPAPTVSARVLPAKGNQQVLVNIEKAGMYRISAKSPEGTSCQVVDHLRGPFARSGQSGKENCILDLLLDPAKYKLRLQSPKNGTHQTQIEVRPFEEIVTPPLQLDAGHSISLQLPPGQQASYWIRVDRRQEITLRVYGRTAGVCKLWRNGEWVEELPAFHQVVQPNPNQPLHEWELHGMLEAGDFLLTVYAADALQWAKGQEDNQIFVANGYEPGPSDKILNFSLPFFGKAAYQIPPGRPAAVLSLFSPQPTLTSLEVDRFGQERRSGGYRDGRCTIQPNAQIPECWSWGSSEESHILTVSGSPGSQGQLSWGTYADRSILADNTYTSGTQQLTFEVPEAGSYWVSTHDVPADNDAIPLSCQLDSSLQSGTWKEVAKDFLVVGLDKSVVRKFNYNGHSDAVWFEVAGAASYTISTGSELKTRCMLYQIGEGAERIPVSGVDSAAETCRIQKVLDRGFYELTISGGREGIEDLQIKAYLTAITVLSSSAAYNQVRQVYKSSCVFPNVQLEKGTTYRVLLSRGGTVHARGLMLKKRPFNFSTPLSLTLEAGQEIRLPIAATSGLRIRYRGGAKDLSCAYASGIGGRSEDGICNLSSNLLPDELVLTNHSDKSLHLTLQRTTSLSTAPSTVNFQASPPPALPVLTLGKVHYFDFERGQSHSLLLNIPEAGVYHATTEGLLATECWIRTPTVERLASDRGSGRGRNCLLSGFLRSGKYLVTVSTTGQSRGRAGVVLSRQTIRKGQAVSADGDAFFRVEPGDVLRQQLTIRKTGRYSLGTTALGATLQCRWEDLEGWPLLPVPASCQQTDDIAAGTYLWTQMPLTVESMRHTKIYRELPPLVLRGKQRHPLILNKVYQVELGSDPKNEFGFALPADLDVEIALTNGMQGRVKRAEAPFEVLETIGPAIGSIIDSPESFQPSNEEPPPPESNESSEEGANNEAQSDDGQYEPTPSPSPAVSNQLRTRLRGQKLQLKAGKYVLVTEHSQGNIGIRYQVAVRAEMLAPGMSDEVQVPSTIVIRIPNEAMIHIKTRGDTDVRCRLFDAFGRLVLESDDIDADWNCSAASPLLAGDYHLVLEAQNTKPGDSTLSISSLPIEKVEMPKDGQLSVSPEKVIVASLPKGNPNTLQGIQMQAQKPFTCALENESGAVLDRKDLVHTCQFLLNPSEKSHRIRLWTIAEQTNVKASFQNRPILPLEGDIIPKGQAAILSIPNPGTYRTNANLLCIASQMSGVLKPCSPEVSLESGTVIFSTFGASEDVKFDLQENSYPIEQARTSMEMLNLQPFVRKSVSKSPSLRFLKVRMPAGEQGLPVCSIDQGLHLIKAGTCYAASGPTTSSVLRYRTTSEKPVSSEVMVSGTTWTDQKTVIEPGIRDFSWDGPLQRFTLPTAPWLVDLILPRDSWAVQVNETAKTKDFCASEGELERCTLSGSGGELYLFSNAERRVRIKTLLTEKALPISQPLDRLAEFKPTSPGQVRFTITPSPEARTLEVTGASRCTLVLDETTRLDGCVNQIPPGQTADLGIDHQTDPIRAMLFLPGQSDSVRWGAKWPLGFAAMLEPGRTCPLTGSLMDRMFTLRDATLVQVSADSGVCAMFSEKGLLLSEGMGEGCNIRRLLRAGSYRLAVRPFAALPLVGSIHWTAQSAGELQEGIGTEEWIAPGDSQWFKFAIRSDGEIGLGVRSNADVLDCAVLDQNHKILGTGCQQFLHLGPGEYLLSIRLPLGLRPMRFRPVVLGLAGSAMDIPKEYLQDFFKRIGVKP